MSNHDAESEWQRRRRISEIGYKMTWADQVAAALLHFYLVGQQVNLSKLIVTWQWYLYISTLFSSQFARYGCLVKFRHENTGGVWIHMGCELWCSCWKPRVWPSTQRRPPPQFSLSCFALCSCSDRLILTCLWVYMGGTLKPSASHTDAWVRLDERLSVSDDLGTRPGWHILWRLRIFELMRDIKLLVGLVSLNATLSLSALNTYKCRPCYAIHGVVFFLRYSILITYQPWAKNKPFSWTWWNSSVGFSCQVVKGSNGSHII